MNTITIRTPKTIGCSVASTAVLQSIKEKLPDCKIVLYTGFPDLFENLDKVTEVVNLNKEPELKGYDIDWKEYVNDRKPQQNKPLRHLIDHMFEIAEERLWSLARNLSPQIYLSKTEILWAQKEAKKHACGKPLIWLQTRSLVPEKEISLLVWEEIIRIGADAYSFIDLSKLQYTRRQAIALTTSASAGIVLDSFLLHGSEAVKAKNTIVLLVSSYPKVVCYPDQFFLTQTDSTPITAQTVLKTLDDLFNTLHPVR